MLRPLRNLSECRKRGIKMRTVKDFIIIIIISGILGGLVALPFILLDEHFNSFSINYIILMLLKSMSVGASIGFTANVIFIFFYKNVRNNTVWAFLSISFVLLSTELLYSFHSALSLPSRILYQLSLPDLL